MKYLLNASTTRKKTPQSKPIPGREKEMTRNNAGGFAFQADSWSRLERFLILGSEGGTYYVGESDLTTQNVDNVRACLATDGLRVVRTITEISLAGRAPKNDPAIYALALAASYGPDVVVRESALSVLPKVCRIGTHLFTFAAFIDSMRGWGPALRKAVGAWYLDKPVDKLAYQVVKYQQRNGWSHRDLLRLAHVKPTAELERVLGWVVNGGIKCHCTQIRKDKKPVTTCEDCMGSGLDKSRRGALLDAFEEAKTANEKTLVRLIRDCGLTREMIPTEHQKSPAVWEALLEKMPPTAMIRTLGRMGSVGLLKPLSAASKVVCQRLGDRDLLRKARVHPIQVLSAILTYRSGRGLKGSLNWVVVPQVDDALDAAFYATFDNVEPTGKRFYLGVDVSGSMTMGQVAGVSGLTPNMGAAAMAMLVARTEPNYFIGGFSDQFIDLKVSARDKLETAMRKCQRNYGATDCAIAIKHALTNKYPVDAFVVITDGETWAGDVHACQALVDYRKRMGIDSKLIVINMVANHTKLTDLTDLGSLDVVGFDASVPALIAEFLGSGNKVSSRPEDAD